MKSASRVISDQPKEVGNQTPKGQKNREFPSNTQLLARNITLVENSDDVAAP